MTIKVDLLDKPGRRSGFDPVLLFLIVVVIFAIGGFYFIGSTLDKQVATKKGEIRKVEEEIATMEDKIPTITKLVETNKELENQINVIKELVYDPIRYANLMDELAYIMPKNVFINSLTIEPKEKMVTFSGMSIEYMGAKPLDQISKFMQNIQQSKYFTNATLPSTSRAQIEGRQAFAFSIRAQYNPEAAAQD